MPNNSESLPKEVKQVLEVDEKEIKKQKFTPEEVDKIGEAIFGGDDSLVDKGAKKIVAKVSKPILGYELKQKELEGYQKILLAPANAVEGVIKFGISLFDKKTYSQMAETVRMVKDKETRAVLGESLKKGWENCSSEEKAAFVTEIAFTSLVAYGGVTKLIKVGSSLPKISAITKGVAGKSTGLSLAKLGKGIGDTAKWVAASPIDDVTVVGGAIASNTTKIAH